MTAQLSPLARFDNLLLATDGSEISQGAVRAALHMASRCGSRLTVMHMARTLPDYAMFNPEGVRQAEDQGRAARAVGYCRCHWPLTSRTTAGRSPGRPSDSQRPASWLSVMARERTRPASMPACVAHWRMRASSWRLPTM